MGISKIFKKKDKSDISASSSSTSLNKEAEMVYSMEPRHGHKQDVYDEDGIRQVAGCLPIDPIKKRFLLISSSSNPGVWVIPKGGWEKDETQKQAAMRETWEEAGVKGVITRHIGVFAEKTKTGIKAHHWIYEMEIKEVTKKFPEQNKRERRWFTYNEAMLAVKSHYIHDALSMSSISPVPFPASTTIENEKKKKKDKKKKKSNEETERNNDSTTASENDVDDDDEKKKKKKKDKKKKKEGGDSSNEDENNSDKEKKREKKKNKEKRLSEEKTDLSDENLLTLINEDKKKKKDKNKKNKKEEDASNDLSYTLTKEEKIETSNQPLSMYYNTNTSTNVSPGFISTQSMDLKQPMPIPTNTTGHFKN